MPDETATRRELGELRRSLNGNLQRLERTMQEHQEEHRAEVKARTAGRRWLAGFLVGLAVALEAPLLYLVAHMH